jgi:integrase
VLHTAEEWGEIGKRVKIKHLKRVKKATTFYGFDELDRLVLAAERHRAPSRQLMVLLGGEAGLRCGELLGLRWSDIDLEHGLLTVSRAIWKREEGPPQGGRSRTLPLAPRLAEALAKYRNLRLQGPGCFARRRAGPFATGSRISRPARAFSARVLTSCGTPSARTWPCEASRRARSRSWPATRASRPPSGT